MKKHRPTCYMCDQPSVGKDHVPPKCLFPSSSVHRQSLVKVPSCDKHNSGRSADDQLLRWVLTTANSHTELAKEVLNEHAVPLLDDRHYLRETFQPDLSVRVSETGIVRTTFAIDPIRFYNSITAIVRGLYYHHTWHTDKALGYMEICWSALKSRITAQQALDFSDFDYAEFTSPSPNQPEYTLGGNPKVFRYGFDFGSDPNYAVCILRFYEGEAIYVRWKQSEREYSTKLASIVNYSRVFGELGHPPATGSPEQVRTELRKRHTERNAQLANIMNEARRERDFGGLVLARLLRAKNDRQMDHLTANLESE